MEQLTHYELNEDGTFDVTVKNVRLGNNETLLLDSGYPLEAEINIVDGRKITIKQRKKIFSLLNDIYQFSGQPQEDLRQMFQFYVEMIKGYNSISLKNCSMTVANELIEVIISWCFLHHVPLNYKTTDLLKDDNNFLYAATINRNCVICGKPSADLAHRQAIGRGFNRRTMNHYGFSVLALCRNHHNEQHAIGVDSFDNKYHLKDSWILVDDRINQMLQGKKEKEKPYE